MSDAISGVGTVLRRWNGSSAWANLAEVNSIKGPGMTRDTIDVTSLDSIGGYREFIGGFRDGGTLTFSMNFTRANYDLMKSDFESSDMGNYELVLPDSDKTSIEFEGLVTELPLTIPMDDKVTIDVTIKISGSPTVASGSNTSLNG
jgi:predicted secreted protein